MIRTLIVLLLCGGARLAWGGPPSCSIQRAAALGANVWLLCENHVLLVSPDAGKSWQQRRLPEEGEFRAVAFIDPRRGFLAGDGGTLLATQDGGETWRPVRVPTRQNLTSIRFLGELGWMAGWAGVILHSEDAGKTWREQPTGVLQGLESIFFADARNGWAAGWLGTILRTADGGKTWERARTPDTLWSVDAVYFRNVKEGWAVGFGGMILQSRDGGVTWQSQAAPTQSWLKSVAFDGSGRGWIASPREILVSEDEGRTWRAIPVDLTLFPQQVLPQADGVWIVCQFGVLKQGRGAPGLTELTSLSG
jgi:photosystem II stability/assembly factor-like uncharacterized protein